MTRTCAAPAGSTVGHSTHTCMYCGRAIVYDRERFYWIHAADGTIHCEGAPMTTPAILDGLTAMHVRNGEMVCLGVSDGLPFAGRSAYGGAPLVTPSDPDAWGVGTIVRHRPTIYALSVSRVVADGGTVTVLRHPLDHTTYATQDDADRAAYDAGLLRYMFYRVAS